MASTIYSYNLTGGRVFPIAFEYLARRFVRITLVGTARQELQLNVDYRFISKTEIETTVALPPGEFQTLEVRRVTSATDRLVNFTDGSILRSQDLNISQIQAIHIAEEGRDVAENSLLTDGFTWDALGRPIRNVGAPTRPGDAANMAHVADTAEYSLRSTEKLRLLPFERSNKLLGFDSNRQPVAIIPSTGTSMELEMELLDAAKGAGKIGFTSGTLRDYIADADDLGLTTLNAIIKYSALHNVPVRGRGTYTIISETINLAGKTVRLNLSESIVQRTAEASIILNSPSFFVGKFGEMRDTLSLATRMIQVFGGNYFKMSYELGVSDGTPLYASGVARINMMEIRRFTAFTQPVANAGQGRPFELKSCSKVIAWDFHWDFCGTGPKIEAVATGTTDDLMVGNFTGDTTFDTSLFLRLVATDGVFRRMVLSQGTINKAGKAGLKFSADSAQARVLRQAIVSNVVVTGYAHNVSSPGISSFKDSLTDGVLVGEIIFSNVIVDGFALDGTIGTTKGDCSGVSCRYMDHAVLNGIITRNTLNQGINIQAVTKVSGAGNIVTGAGQSAPTDPLLSSGLCMTSVTSGTLQVDSHNNFGSGVYLDKVKWCRLSGVLSGNGRYGIETKAQGLASTQTTGNTYQFTMIANNLGPANYVERVSDGIHSEEIGCIDDSGTRSKGTTARRNALSLQWSLNMFIGRTFWNMTTNKMNYWTGSAWVE